MFVAYNSYEIEELKKALNQQTNVQIQTDKKANFCTNDKVSTSIVDHGLERSTIEFFKQYGTINKYDVGTILAKEGDPSDSVFLIIQGIVDVLKNYANHCNGIHLESLTQGSIMGEMGIFLQSKRSATLKCKTEVIAFKFSNELFIEAISKKPKFAIRIMRSFALRVDQINKKLTKMHEDLNR